MPIKLPANPSDQKRPDRNLLEDRTVQEFWKDARSASLRIGTFTDHFGRGFTAYLKEYPLRPAEKKDDAAAGKDGFERILYIGAIGDTDGKCYGGVGFYFSPAKDHVLEKTIEVDRGQRAYGIGRGLLEIVGKHVVETLGKTFYLTGEFTPGALSFTRHLKRTWPEVDKYFHTR